MDSDLGKLFIGGISWETTEEKLAEHFGQYGEVLQAVIMRDKLTNRPRGFGFVAFADPLVLDRVLADKHTIDNRTVEAKRALAREEQHTRPGNAAGMGRTGSGGFGGGGNMRTKKIFVGGLPSDLTEDAFRQYFQNYGIVTDTVVMYDAQTQRPRGFGFISFDTEDSVDKVLHKTFHELNGKLVEVKRALPKDGSSSTAGRPTGGGAYGGGSGASTGGSYDRVPPQSVAAAGGGYPSYGAAPGYGYGQAVQVNNGGMGGAGGGYGGPVGPYLNPSAGYMGGGQGGALRSPWNSQAPAGYGAAASWNNAAGAGGGGSTGAPPATGYGGQGYGYGGGYGAREGSYGGQGGSYGRGDNPAGGTEQAAAAAAAASGYMGGGGYGDPNGSSGYPAPWRSDPSQGGGGYGAAQVAGPPGGYSSGGVYGGAQLRHGQQQ